MDRSRFNEILQRFLDGNCSEEEAQLVDQWYELLDGAAQDLDMPEQLQERLWAQVADKIAAPGESRRRRTIIPLWLKYAAAAAVFIVIGTGVYYYKSANRANYLAAVTPPAGFSTEDNGTASTRKLLLQDGTSVILQPRSKLSFPKNFVDSSREVYLEGDAFFDVARDKARPFLVYHRQLITRVLGTSFTIRSLRDTIEVSVRTGRVAVYENGKTFSGSGVVITPNQKVVYAAQSKRFVTGLSDSPEIIDGQKEHSPAESAFTFDEAPLSSVVDSIEHAYGIAIVIENPQLYHCSFTGDLTRQSLYKKLKFICQAFQATYTIEGTKIVMHGGTGCN